MFFYSLICSFLIGVFISDIGNLNIAILFPIFLLILFLLIYQSNLKIISIIIFFIFGFLRFEYIEKINNADFLLDKENKFEGIIIKEPDKRELNTHYVVYIPEFNSKIRLTNNHFPKFEYKDEITFSGVLKRPEKFKNENDIYFDYPKFLEKDGIAYVLYYPKIIDFKENDNKNFYYYLIYIKNWFTNNLNKNLKEPQGALASGILIGSKQSLGENLLEDFRRAGLIHLVVLSGYNVTIIADAVKKSLSFLPFLYKNIISIFFIISFAILTGSSATTIRASIMAIIAIFAQSSNKNYHVSRALWVAAFFMVLHNPHILTGDPGFQLSFLATIGLIHLSPLISKILFFIPEKFALRENISSTISTQIVVLPLLIKMTGEISLIAVFSNILILPFMPISMLLSAVSGIFTFLGPITKIFSISAYILLSYIIFIAERFSNLSFAVLKVVFNDVPI